MRDRTSWAHHAAAAVVTGLVVAGGATASSSSATSLRADEIAMSMGLREVDIVDVTVAPTPGGEGMVVTVDGMVLDLAPHSVRSADHYEVLMDVGGGRLIPVAPQPLNTWRGVKIDEPGSFVAASIDERGVTALIRTAAGERLWLEPADGVHVMYGDDDVLDLGFTCGMDHKAQPIARAMPMDGGAAGGGGEVCVTELGIDADFDYFQDWGSVAGVENRVNQVINTMNVQYEEDVQITHEITTIIVRTSPGAPYTSNDPQGLLTQFRNEWLNNQGLIPRDVAHLFTGKNLNGSTIGIAWTLGSICSNATSYCLAQSDFNGAFACATDLSAHELGHLWDGAHCSCPSFTMNPSITCANQFSNGTINSIIAYRNTRPCLDCGVINPPLPPFGPTPADGALGVEADVQLRWVNGGGAESFEVYLSLDSTITPDDLAAVVATPFWQPDPALEFETSYFWQVVAVNEIGEAAGPLWFFQTGPDPTPPSNDLCENASLVGEGLQAFDTTFAGTDGDDLPGACDDGAGVAVQNDVWFEYAPTCTGDALIATCGLTSFDSRIAVYGGGAACPPSNDDLLACADVSEGCPGGGASITLSVVAGETYLVRIGAAADDGGTGSVVITCTPVKTPPCPADFDGDGTVGSADLATLLSEWGGPGTVSDLDDDGTVGPSDLAILLGAWGACPTP